MTGALIIIVASLIALTGLIAIVVGVRDEMRLREPRFRSRDLHPSKGLTSSTRDRAGESRLMAEIEEWLKQQQ
jgi:hypothetical protein